MTLNQTYNYNPSPLSERRPWSVQGSPLRDQEVEGSPIREASPERLRCLWLKNEASLHAYSVHSECSA